MQFISVIKALTLREKITVVLLFSALLALHLKYTPWLFGSEPVEALEKYDLSNEPAPKWAQTFSINHGAAIYYKDNLPEFHPRKTSLIYAAAFILWLGLVVLGFLGYRRTSSEYTNEG